MSIIESGHYYASHGPTELSLIGWELLEEHRAEDDLSLLFIDDVPGHVPGQAELSLPPVEFEPDPDVTIYEASLLAPSAAKLMEMLDNRTAKTSGGKVRIKGIPVGEYGDDTIYPWCTALDLELTQIKSQYSPHAINILPDYWIHEQMKLVEIVEYLGGLSLTSLVVLLYDGDGVITSKIAADI